MDASSEVRCLSCGSQDVQEIVKNMTVIKEKKGCSGGCLGRKVDSKPATYRYYACRSCGREFETN